MTTARTRLIVAALALTFCAAPALAQQVDLAGLWSATLGNFPLSPTSDHPPC